MTAPVLLGLYRPGRTLFHRLPVGAKVLGLFVYSGVVVVVRGDGAAGVFLAVSILGATVARLGLWTMLRALRPALVAAVFFGAFVTWQTSWHQGAEVVGDLFALVIAATILTATTPITAMLDAIVTWLQPLRRLGVDPERVGLTFSLMMRAVPTTMETARETRDAARARGLERSPRARLTPLVIRTVAHAYETGDALHARGIGDD
ncbi:MAG: energy-coupling factor transporter transrane protein EcfT [Aeromicrobium sp.]|nr:energy-coupling factor transporter transrane protein EcfT [Aeromicrobium sp.]